MPLLESFRQKEVSSLNHGLSSTLSPLAPPFTVKRNAVNQRPSSSQLVEPTFRDYSSPLSGSLDNCLHLHPPTSVPDSWRPIDVGAGLGVSNYPTSAVGGVPNSYSYSSGTYEYTSVPVNMELGEERVIADEPYSTPLVLGVQDAAGSGFGSSTGSSMLEYFPWQSDYSIYFSGAAPAGSTQNSGYSANVSKYKPSVQRERFQCAELVKETQISDVGESSERPSLPKIKTCRSNSTCPQEQELFQHSPGFSASEGLPAINQGKYINSSGRPSQSGAKVTDLKSLCGNHQAEISKNNTQLSFFELSGASTSSPGIPLHDYDPPSSDVLSATSAWAFLKSDAVSTNKCFIEHGSCTTDSTAVYPFTQVSQSIPSGNHLLNDTVISENVDHGCLPVDELVNSKDLAGYFFTTGKGTETNSIVEDNLVHHSKGDHDASTNYNTICSQGMKDSYSSYQGALDCFSEKRPFGNLDFTASTLNLFPSASEQSLDVSAASCQNFYEKNDQFISAVDSPCWKGIPSFRCFPSEAAENVSSQCFKHFEPSDQPLLIHNGTVSLSEASSQLIWANNERIGGSSPPAMHMTAASLFTQTKSADADEGNLSANKSYSGNVYEGIQRIGEGFSTSNSHQEGHELKMPTRVSLTNEKWNTISIGESFISEATVKGCSNYNKGPFQDGLSDLSRPVGHIQSSLCAGTSVSTDVHEKINGLSLNPSEYLPEKTDIHILLKAMHNLSALLLSRCYADQDALKEHDLELLQLVTNNLDECIIKQSNHLSEPCPLESSHVEKLRDDPCKFTCIEGSQGIPAESIDDIRHTGNKKTTESGRSIHMGGTPKNTGPYKFASFHNENGVRKAMEKLLRDKLDNESDDLPQIEVYKALWLEAEAALCAMKYEVRLAKMNAEMLKGKQNHDATGSLNARSNSSSGLLSSLNGTFDAIDGGNQDLHVAKSSPSEPNDYSFNARSNISPGVMSSLNGVGDATDASDQNLHEAKNSASEHNDMESSVIARFRILKRRIERSNEQEEQQSPLPDSIDIESTQRVDIPVIFSEIRTEIGNHKQPPAKVAASLVPAISPPNTQASRTNGDFGAVGVITRSQLESKGLLSKHNDVEAAVAARIKILKERNEKCSIADKEPAILPDSIDVEGIDCNQQPEVAVLGHSSQSMALAPETSKNFNRDICFTAQSWQPFAVASLQDTLSVNLHDQLGARHTESPGTCASTTGNTHHMHPMPWQEVETSRGFHAQASNGLVSIKRPNPSGGVHNRGNEPVKVSDKRSTGGATSSSQSDSTYDWEHVLKDEISC